MAWLHQHIPYRRILAKLRLGIRTQWHDLGLRLARPDNQRIQQLAAYALAGEGGVDLGVVDDDQRGVGPAVGHLGEVAALGAGDEEGAFGVGFLVLNGMGHGPIVHRAAGGRRALSRLRCGCGLAAWRRRAGGPRPAAGRCAVLCRPVGDGGAHADAQRHALAVG